MPCQSGRPHDHVHRAALEGLQENLGLHDRSPEARHLAVHVVDDQAADAENDQSNPPEERHAHALAGERPEPHEEEGDHADPHVYLVVAERLAPEHAAPVGVVAGGVLLLAEGHAVAERPVADERHQPEGNEVHEPGAVDRLHEEAARPGVVPEPRRAEGQDHEPPDAGDRERDQESEHVGLDAEHGNRP